MRRIAALLGPATLRDDDHRAALRACLAEQPAAAGLLAGPLPPSLISLPQLRDSVADQQGLPPWLIEASRRATGDLAEALALLLPPPTGAEPDLAEVLGDLASLPPGPLALPAILAMAARLPAEARTLYFRLVTGSFRAPLTPAELTRAMTDVPATDAARFSLLAVMIYAEAALTTGARGPEITLALRDGPDLVPIARARAKLPAPQTAALMACIRSESTGRFGPLRALPARHVFRLGFASVTPNHRRKCGVALAAPQILAWLPETDPAEIAPLSALLALVPITA